MLSSQNITTMDINMLVSVVNMKLRNNYSSLQALCTSFELEVEVLTQRLAQNGFIYDSDHNQFIAH